MPTNLSKKHFSYTLKDFHKAFRNREKLRGVSLSKVIAWVKYKRILEAFFLAVSKKIIYENFTFIMPYSLGSISVKSRKSLGEYPIDFHSSRKYGRTIYFMNRHTFGMIFFFDWNKDYVRFRNNSYYCFKPIRSKYATRQGVGKTSLGKHIKELSDDPTKRRYIQL